MIKNSDVQQKFQGIGTLLYNAAMVNLTPIRVYLFTISMKILIFSGLRKNVLMHNVFIFTYYQLNEITLNGVVDRVLLIRNDLYHFLLKT